MLILESNVKEQGARCCSGKVQVNFTPFVMKTNGER